MRRSTIGECERNGESRNILDCGGRGCPPSNKLWYQRYMQVQFVPGNCCPEICLCNQQLLQAFEQVSLAPGYCCWHGHPVFLKSLLLLRMMWCRHLLYKNSSPVTTDCSNRKFRGIPHRFQTYVQWIHNMHVRKRDSSVHPHHHKPCVVICSILIAIVPAWEEAQLESVRGMASQETFWTVVAADALQAISCGINATCKCSLFREIVVPRFVCAISNCSKRLNKFLWHRVIVVPRFVCAIGYCCKGLY